MATILIGLGSSGLRILEQAQKMYYEVYGNIPNDIEFLFIETEAGQKIDSGPNQNRIRRVELDLSQMAMMIATLARDPKCKWLPPSHIRIEGRPGAGQMRPVGRLALWGINSRQNNFYSVHHAIQQAYQNVAGPAIPATAGQAPAVFIVGTLTGGTCSATMIDIAYLVRHIIGVGQPLHLYGLFLLPPRPQLIAGNEVSYANAYGALRDLQYYNSASASYDEKWPNGVNACFRRSAYDLVQLISQDYNDGTPQISSLPGLYRLAGLYLFLNLAGGQGQREATLVNATGQGLIREFNTFGLSAIQFPKDQIEEYLAVSLSKELMERWTNVNHFYDQGNPTEISSAAIQGEALKQWDRILQLGLDTLNIVQGQNLGERIRREVKNINKRDIIKAPEDHIFELFQHGNENPNLYRLVNDSIQNALDRMISDIHEYNIKITDRTENLIIGREFLVRISESINQCREFWRSQGITENPAEWNDHLRSKIREALQTKHTAVLEQDEVLSDHLLTIFARMKWHLIFSRLNGISENIRTGENPYASRTQPEKQLPRVSTFDQLIRIIVALKANEGPEAKFQSRMNEIETDINDQTLPILRVFPNQSFQKEVENAKAEYLRTRHAIPSRTDVYGERNLWTVLQELTQTAGPQKLYDDCMRGFRSRIQQAGCVSNYNVADYVHANPARCIDIARKSLPGFVSIGDKVFPSGDAIPRFIVGSDLNSIQGLLQIFQQNTFHEFPGNSQNIFVQPRLQNVFIFYVEKGSFEPLQYLSYVREMREAYDNPPDWWTSSVQEWQTLRNAYVYQPLTHGVQAPTVQGQAPTDASPGANS